MSRLLRRGARLSSRASQARSLPLLALIALALTLSACDAMAPQPSKTHPTSTATPTYDFPAINANYVYDQLYYLSTTFQQRESGFDNSPEHTGHLAFTKYWAQEMQRDLQGFAPQVSYDSFTTWGRSTGGWVGRAGDSPSYNVEVTIPGALHPEQVVVVGTHYDGMHVSQGSAFDDTSGCAILLGEAKALGDYWRAHHLYPARTLRFVIFDAEEQGILGSYHYVNETVNGDLANVVAMINEEQSGFSYPVRFLGKASNPYIPLQVWNVSPDSGSVKYFGATLSAALSVVAKEMRTLGYTTVTYHGANGQDVSQPVFTPDQISQMVNAGLPLGGSDDAGFDQAHVPAMTFIAGDEGALDPETGAQQALIPTNQYYPFDTHLDTIQLMNGYANGETRKSQALALALTFQTMLQAWMFDQPSLVGSVAIAQTPAGPLATISDLGRLQPGTPLHLAAQGAFDPRAPQAPLSYHWDFGDGTQADGAQTQHTYASAGAYTLTLTVKDANGARQIRKRLSVTAHPPTYDNLFIDIEKNYPTGSAITRGDVTVRPDHQMPPIIQNGDGLTSDDHFPGHNG